MSPVVAYGPTPATILAPAVLFAILSCAAAPDCEPASGTVTAVIDGDTIEIDDRTIVRLIGIDAPEKGTCWSAMSTAAATGLLLGMQVDLEFVSRCTDDYGRLLAHVLVDGKCAETILAAGGNACAWNLEDGDFRAGEIRAAARQASSEGKGFWGSCAEVPCRSR